MATMHMDSFARTYRTTLEQAHYLAELCGIDNNLVCGPVRETPYVSHYSDGSIRTENYPYHAWEDKALAGGALRITWHRGIMWISCHSGYPHADRTDDACEFATTLGYEPIDDETLWNEHRKNPRVYGYEAY